MGGGGVKEGRIQRTHPGSLEARHPSLLGRGFGGSGRLCLRTEGEGFCLKLFVPLPSREGWRASSEPGWVPHL